MRILITGGAGFIGSNLAARGIQLGYEVTVLDNLSRAGSSWNLEWLRSLGSFEFVQSDIRDLPKLLSLFRSKQFDAVFHQAAQVAVTTSVQDPRADFEFNALGTLNLLETIRLSGQNPVFIFASTNKVYGSLSSFTVVEQNGRYAFQELPHGVPESVPLDFRSPYACSKGAADQYVLDYRRVYGLRTIVFRQSCVYGPQQMGVEDQGWVAWFAICVVLGRPIIMYGDGKQVRDVLHIDDLVDLYFRAVEVEPHLEATAFNVGGGPEQTMSLLEVIRLLEGELSHPVELRFSDWRPGDQRVYVSDIRAVCDAFRWAPKIAPQQGISSLLSWIQKHRDVFCQLSL
ncbi:MAG: NAD-dependent epimerase/dehydratase family protein [Nitrospinota bacterium]